MIHIFGDSHANYNFSNFLENKQLHFVNGMTMHRIGRDGKSCIDYNLHGIKENDIVIYQVGEVDCRCQIIKQLSLNRSLLDIISTLTTNFINSIKENCKSYNNLGIIVCCIPPPMCKDYYESLHGPITHEFPFLGTDQERAEYTRLVNINLKKLCDEHKFFFLDYYEHYTNENGLLRTELSDNLVHIIDTSHIHNILSDYLRENYSVESGSL